jgi:hypothetical protein
MAPFKNTVNNPINNKTKKTHIQFLKMIKKKISKSHFKIQFKIFILFICSLLSSSLSILRLLVNH